MAYIEIKNLNYSYPKENKKALKDINLELRRGEILFIVGKSGSGKSSLARCISGTIPNFYGGTIGGTIKVMGKDIGHMSHYDRAKEITMVFQDPERQLMMNKVHREIAFGLENIRVPEWNIKRRVWETLQFLNILELSRRDITSLSGGQKQKVAIASALAIMPNCIILDEPISQLDPNASEEVITFIKKINEELGITIIVIEQRIDKWFDIADQVLIMEAGEIAFKGSREVLYHSKYISMLPNYLKAMKELKVQDMPQGFKEARAYIEENLSSNNKRDICSSKMPLKDNLIKRLFKVDKKEQQNSVISLKDVSFSYESIEALKEINLDFYEGEFHCILGANGAGKSTLLKAIMKLLNYKGSIKCFERDIRELSGKELAKNIAYVSQNPNDYISKDTVHEELKFTLDNYGLKDEDSIEEVLKELDIYELKDKNPRDVSGGERQRIAIASMLVLKPKIILLDEPTRGLDYETKKNLGRLLLKLKKTGTTIILVTHDMEFAAEFGDKFILMFDKEVMAVGNKEELFKDGIYYTTALHKLFKNINEDIFILEDLALIKRS